MAKLKTGKHTQAKKADRQSKKRRKFNLLVKTKIKHLIKRVEKAVAEGNATEAKKLFTLATKHLHKAAKKKVIHKKKSARKISRLAKKINKIAKSS